MGVFSDNHGYFNQVKLKMKKVMTSLIILSLVFISGCLEITPAKIEELMSGKCLYSQPFNFTRNGTEYQVNEIEVCMRDKVKDMEVET